MNEEYTPAGSGRTARRLREQLQEMTAAVQLLAPAVAGSRKAAGCLSVLQRGLCRQLRLVRQLELEERLSSPDEIRLNRAPVDLVSLCRRMTERADALISALGLRAEFSTPLTALAALADGPALEEMLLALISASVGSMAPGGSLRLELTRRDRKAVFSLSCTGSGPDASALSGLLRDAGEDDLAPPDPALPLARRIAALHGGLIVAGTCEGGSLCLVISIPLVEGTEGLLLSPALPVDGSGGWDPVLVALSECLPPSAFLPESRPKTP